MRSRGGSTPSGGASLDPGRHPPHRTRSECAHVGGRGRRRLAEARVLDGRRRYTRREIGQVAEALDLTEEGVTLAGVRHVLTLRHRVAQLESDLAELREGRRVDSGGAARG